MTVQEYLDSPWWKKTGYRLMRNLFAMFIIGPIFVFVATSYRLKKLHKCLSHSLI